MNLRAYKPALPLSRHIDLIWRIESMGGGPRRQRVYPSGAMTLVIHLNRPAVEFFIDDESYCVNVPSLAGPYSKSFHIDRSRPAALIGVTFRPGAARLFFPVAAHELHNTDIALSDLDTENADQLLNEVCSSAEVPEQFRVLERFLNNALRRARPLHPAVGYAVEQLSSRCGVQSVRRIQLETGLSHTRFIDLFREHVGLTPKLFCRVERFRALLTRIDKGEPLNWAALAADCGYFDQAHLIRDFRAFAGITPLEYGRTMPESDRRVLAALEAAAS